MSHPLPEAFKIQMQEMLGEEYPGFEATLLHRDVPVSVRRNPFKKGIFPYRGTPVPWCGEGVYLPERPVFALDPLWHAGAYYVQEASSMFTAYVLAHAGLPTRPLRILDLCAAPGGKSTLLASVMPEGSLLVANEPVAARQAVLRENLLRFGHPAVVVTQKDPGDFSDFEGFFDVVLVDAPCSGEGLFRKDEAARAEWSPEHVRFCALRQKRIMGAAFPLLAPGGLLLYATCTYNREEDEGIAGFISGSGLEKVTLEIPASWNIPAQETGWKFFPHRNEGEGFFLAGFRNVSGGLRKEPPAVKSRPVKEKADLETRLRAPFELDWFSEKEGWTAFPSAHVPALKMLQKSLRVRHYGTGTGIYKGKDFIPSQELAWSVFVNRDLFPGVELDRDQALSYLRRQDLKIPGNAAQLGWQLFTYLDVPLGWAKWLPGRINNYYPVEWRLRMQG